MPVNDRAGMSVSGTPGTGTITLGSALGSVSPLLASFLSFASANVVNGQTVSYLILDTGGAWEVGTGVYTSSGTTLTRNPIYSSNANAAINATANAQVFITAIAEDLNQASYGGYRNRLRNPGQDIDQRGTNASIATVTTAGAYVTDGYIVVPTGASCTAQQITRGTGAFLSGNNLTVIGAASITDMVIKIRIESSVAAALAGQQVTFQFKGFNNTGGSVTPKLSAGAPASTDSFPANNGAARTGDLNAVNMQAGGSGATTTFAYSWLGGANLNTGLEISIDLGNNFSSTAKTFSMSDFDVRVTPGAVTGINNYPPPPELRRIETEYVVCQRYFWQQRATGIAFQGFGTGSVNTTTQSIHGFQFPTPMRATPSFTISAGSTWQVIAAGAGFTPTAMTTTAPSSYGFFMSTTLVGATAGQACFLRDAGSGTASVQASAEL